MNRIVFMGTPEFAVPGLRTLIARGEVVGVVTQPDRPAGRGRHLQPPAVKVAAEAAGVPVYQPKSLRSEETAGRLREWQPDVIVVAAFGQILRRHVLELPRCGCLNVHASLLPRWRGASPIQHAILAGDRETGISLMRMDAGLDTGPVYAQEATAIGPEETAATLHDRLAGLGAATLAKHLDSILDGRLAARSQDDSRATYAPLIQKEAGQIDWRQPAEQIDRQVRAMTPWPGAYTTWQGKSLKILKATTVTEPEVPAGRAGVVVAAEGDAVVVVAGEGGLRLLEVQLEGKRPSPIGDFLRGRPELAGSQLGGQDNG